MQEDPKTIKLVFMQNVVVKVTPTKRKEIAQKITQKAFSEFLCQQNVCELN